MSEATPPQPEPAPAPDGNVSASALKRRALLGGIALAARTVIVQFVVLAGTVVLARRLTPREFGAFAIVGFAITFFTVFGDAGLGGALIQRREKPTQAELSSVFWMQVFIGLAVLGITCASAGVLSLFFKDLPPEAPWLLRVLAFDFLATSLRVVPTILMERELQFVRLSVLDTINTVAFYLAASIVALAGGRIWSLAVGVAAQAVLSLVVSFALRPFRPTFVFDRAALRPLLRFGIPFQLKFVLGMALSAIMPVWGGRALGAVAVGLLNWAQTTAHFPLRLVEIVGRVSFPLYSRLRDDRVEFASAIERSVRITAFGTLFFVGLIMGLAPNVTHVVYSEQWMPAVPLLYVYAATISIGFLTPVLATVFDSLGDPGTILRLSLWVTLGIWITVPPASIYFGTMGFAVGYVTWMVIGNVAIIVILRTRFPDAKIVAQLRGPFAGAVVTAIASRLLFGRFAATPATLTLAILASAVIFVAAASMVDPAPVRDLWNMARKKKAVPQSAAG